MHLQIQMKAIQIHTWMKTGGAEVQEQDTRRKFVLGEESDKCTRKYK